MPFPEATPRQLEAIPSFDGGVNSRLAVWNLEQQFAADMQDIDVSRVGR